MPTPEIVRELVNGEWVTTVGSSGGGGGGVSEITSQDNSVTITDPTGPTVDLSVSGGSQPLTRTRVTLHYADFIEDSGSAYAPLITLPDGSTILWFAWRLLVPFDYTGVTDGGDIVDTSFDSLISAFMGLDYASSGGPNWASGPMSMVTTTANHVQYSDPSGGNIEAQGGDVQIQAKLITYAADGSGGTIEIDVYVWTP